MSRIPRVRRWWVRYYNANGDLVRTHIVEAPTRLLARLTSPMLIAVPFAERRTVSTR